MAALDHGASIALVLVGIAALLAATALLWRVLSHARTDRHRLEQQEADRHRVALRQQAHTRERERWMEFARALLPAATGLVGLWLGRQSGRHDHEGQPPPGLLGCEHPCMGCRHPRSPLGAALFGFPRGDGETDIELDFDSLLAGLRESGLGDSVMALLQRFRASPAPSPTPAPAPEAEPEPDCI